MHQSFGKRLTPTELLRRNQLAINRAMREMEREKRKMEQQENKLIVEIKKMAKLGQNDSVKILAKDLVRTRHYIKKFNMIQANFRAISLKILTFKSYNTMTEAMRNITIVLRNINRRIHLPQIQRILRDFEKEVDMCDIKENYIDDSIDDTFDNDEDEEESEQILNKVLDELGLQLTDTLATLPPAINGDDLSNLQTTSAYDENDLVRRLKRLRKE